MLAFLHISMAEIFQEPPDVPYEALGLHNIKSPFAFAVLHLLSLFFAFSFEHSIQLPANSAIRGHLPPLEKLQLMMKLYQLYYS